ncbi:outer membrane protein assembly factor BamC [Kaarinaea lacus]
MLSIRFIVVLSLSVCLVACGMLKNEKEYAYLNAKSSRQLQMPEGLIAPHGSQPLLVPEVHVDTIDLTNDLLEPPQIVKSVDLAELDDESTKKGAESKTKSGKEKETESSQVALLSIHTRTEEGDSMLLVDGDFNTVWPMVAPALKELGFTIDDSSRGSQIYTISKELITVNIDTEPVHPGDEKPAIKEEYQIHLKEMDEKTQITVHNKYGELEGSGLSDHLLLQIKELLAKPGQKSQDDG